MKKLFKRIFFGLFIVFVGIQFIPTKLNVSTEIYKSDFMNIYEVPKNISAKIKVSCYDCHSNNTAYPWYNRIQPVTWYLNKHINHGKEEVNFNAFGNYSERRQLAKLSSIIREIEADKMPLSSYLNMHENAEINNAEKKELLIFFEDLKNTLELKKSTSVQF